MLCARKGKTTSRDAQPPREGGFPLARAAAALPAIPSSCPQFLFDLVCRCADEGSCMGRKGADMLKNPPQGLYLHL